MSIYQVGPKQISVVIQGPTLLEAATETTVEETIWSAKKVLPGAEIIVSTWADQKVPDDSEVRVITSPDPGPLVFSGLINNVNRQIVSTLAGIKHSTRPYILKLRADLTLSDRRLCVIQDPPPDLLDSCWLEKQITITSLGTPNHTVLPKLFHASDLVQFGDRRSMTSFWNQTLKSLDEVFLPIDQASITVARRTSTIGYRLVPEQSLVLDWLARGTRSRLSLEWPGDGDLASFELWERTLLANFFVIPWEQSGIRFPARFTLGPGASRVASNLYMGQKELVALTERVLARDHAEAYRLFDRARSALGFVAKHPRLHVVLDALHNASPWAFRLAARIWRRMLRLK